MEKKLLRFTVNEVPYEIYINPKTLLVEAIRDHIGLTGTKRGCETVSCGACTVMVDGMAVKGCSILAMQVNAIATQPIILFEDRFVRFWPSRRRARHDVAQWPTKRRHIDLTERHERQRICRTTIQSAMTRHSISLSKTHMLGVANSSELPAGSRK